ncbi:helix-hairpin-helix domain-containing protein [Verrucomicrobiaceae bacterium R5-34]|nr:helix-hairpin-helix domain-containing protein [Verrucomicrobiaceae bacterium R5-34]
MQMMRISVRMVLVRALCLGVLCVFGGVAQAAPLVKIENCTLVPTEWADGDSFRIHIPEKLADGDKKGWNAREITVRLYGADCVESAIRNATDGRRVRAQRRYFGISKKGTSRESIELALSYGKKATEQTRQLLANPFTVYTSFADGRGDPKFKRVYAFVVTADGKDLAAELVRLGLARAFGVERMTPEGQPAKDYAAYLDDLELQAAKRGAGVWQHTDWQRLPDERQAQREEEREDRIGMGKDPQVVAVNKAAKDELMAIPGIGEVTANRIIAGRPYRRSTDLLKVPGIGKKTLEKIQPFLTFPVE